MARVTISGISSLGNALQTLLVASDIVPGDSPSYQLCKEIYLYHPLGAKIAEAPIEMAQSQKREISVPDSPQDRVVKAFEDEWKAIGADRHIFNVMSQSRVYGIASIALLTEGGDSSTPLDFKKLARDTISFNVLDPLNTAGSLVLSQNPNAMDFQKHVGVSVAGKHYHRSRTITMLNESPIYISYTQSAFGFVGRSVYQRALFPLKSFVGTMVTDDMISRKAGLIIAKLKAVGSIINGLMQKLVGNKRELLKEAETNNVLTIDESETIESLDLQNLDGAATMARTNILKNIATAVPMPAKLLENETMVAGFGEGTEDAKNIARYVDRTRGQMAPLYDFFDRVVMYRAWNEEFYATIQEAFPEEYGKVDFASAFYRWRNSFAAEWPSLLTEPDSEKVKVEETKLKAIIALIEALLPQLDPANKALLITWACDNVNANEMMFPDPLNLDPEGLKAHFEDAAAVAEEIAKAGAQGGVGGDEPAAPKPFSEAA